MTQNDLGQLAALTLDTNEDRPLYQQLYFGLRDAILNGRIAPGAKLLSAREMAREMTISRNTVNTAFEQLSAEGYIVSKVGSGSYVAEGLPDVQPRQSSSPLPTGSQPSLSDWGESLRGRPSSTSSRGDTPLIFGPGLPDLESFPFPEWSRLLGRRWRHPRHDLTAAAHPGGYRPLREAVSDYLKAGRALNCTADQVIITTGAQQALDLAFRILLNPGDRIWAEDPGFPGIDGALASVGATVVPVPLDENGLDINAGQRLAPDVRAALVTPSRNFPLGQTMSLNRRLELLAWAVEANSWIIEDDFDSEFRFDGRPLAALQGMDRSDRVLYAGTFSRVTFPSLRLGYLIVPQPLVDICHAARLYMDGHGGLVAQAALADFFADGSFASHLRRLKKLYRIRGHFLEETINRQLGHWLKVIPVESGMHLVAELRYGKNDRAVAKSCRKVGLGCRPLSPFYRGDDKRYGLVLGFAGHDEVTLDQGTRRLSAVLSDFFDHTR